MKQHYLPTISEDALQQLLHTDHDEQFLELLVAPLHEELYRRQDFNFLDELSMGQRLVLSYDYLVQQVGQGGFIQFLANGYVGLLPEMPALLEAVGAQPMAQLIDDVLKAYVVNVHHFQGDLNTQQFAKLYADLKEFDELEERFKALHTTTQTTIANFARANMEQFVS